MKTLASAFRHVFLLLAFCVLTLTAGVEATAQQPLPARTVLEQRLISFLNELNLTETQKTQIEAILREERSAIEPLLRQLISAQETLRDATRGGRFDEAQIRAIVSGMTPTVVELIVAKERVLSKIYQVLTPEQRALLQQKRDELWSEFTAFSGMTPGGFIDISLLETIGARLGLTPTQQLAAMFIVLPEYQHIEALGNALASAQEQIRAVTANDHFDEAQVRAIAVQYAQTVGELVVVGERVLSKLYAILTPGQRAKLDSWLDDALARLRGLLDLVSIDNARFFVWQHYADFFGRTPDQSGWDFWTEQITGCGSDAACLSFQRVNVSGAYFLSIEFQQTGYFVYRFYNAALNRNNDLPRYQEFLNDTRQVGRGVVVSAPGWDAQLEQNKQAFAHEFVSRAEFIALYPANMTPAQYVDALFAHARIMPSTQERQQAIDEFNTPDGARARVLRRVAESETLSTRELNRAFVLMQYFGYLRRNPDDAPDRDYSGYNFWLSKLNQFNGDFHKAEMVKAFIDSGEYRRRFGN